MPIQRKGDFHGGFVVMSTAAVDIASNGAVGSVDTVISVEALDGVDQAPLQLTDWVMQVILPATFTAGVAVQTALVTSTSQITLRTTNASAAPIDPASIAANGIKFLIARP